MTRTALALAALVVTLAVPGVALAAQPVPVSYHDWVATSFNQGTPTGLAAGASGLSLLSGTTSGTWTSPVYDPRLGFSELVASWNATTPSGSWLKVEMRGLTQKGTWTNWYVMGDWAYDDVSFRRTSIGGQGDADGTIAIDTFFAKDKLLTRYQLRVTLNRSASGGSPTLRRIGAVASDAPNQKPSIPTAFSGRGATLLNVPQYSQEIHAGHFPEYDGGGEAWCSPTSTSMVLAYWGALPDASEWAWVGAGHTDPWVDNTARYVYDYHYNGAGNWPFNTAYAGALGLDAFVTQLRGLDEAEQFIRAGIPLVASVASNPNKLTGFLLDKGTNGHLLVIVGFTAAGDPIVNDPAAASDATVQRVYDRAEFERAWLPASGGIVYVIKRPSVPLPLSLGGNW